MRLILILKGSTSDSVEFIGDSYSNTFDGERSEVRVVLDASEYDRLGSRNIPEDDHGRGPDTPEKVAPSADRLVQEVPEAFIYRITEQGKGDSNHTIESYKAMGWTMDEMLGAGFVEKIPVVEEPETPPPSTALVEAEKLFTMLPLANGATREQFEEQGWTEDQMIEQGFAEWKILVVPDAPAVEEIYTGPWPRALGNDRWINLHGVVFDKTVHARTRNNPPKVKVDGHWKDKVAPKPKEKAAPPTAPSAMGVVGTDAAPVVAPPAAPPPPPASLNASTAPSAPSAPSAPAAPSVSSAEEDASVAEILDNWDNSDAPAL